MDRTKIDFIGFNASVKKEDKPGEIEILVHAGHMELSDAEIGLIKKETENFADKIYTIINV